MPHTDLTNLTKWRVASPSLVGFAECFLNLTQSSQKSQRTHRCTRVCHPARTLGETTTAASIPCDAAFVRFVRSV